MGTANPEVDAWLDERDHPLDDAMRLVRRVVLDADDRIAESIKWKTPTFDYKGNLFSFSPSKKVVSLMFHRGAEIPGDHPGLVGDAKLVRTMRFADAAEVERRRDELVAVVRAWCDHRDAS